MSLLTLGSLSVVVMLVILTTAVTVWLVKTRPPLENDPDTIFWYIFAGLCVLMPAILITAFWNSWAALTLAVLACATWKAAERAISGHLRKRTAQIAQTLRETEHTALARRHKAVLIRWSRYELDPGAAIDFPNMNNIRYPETSALVKAAAVAERHKNAPPNKAENSATAAPIGNDYLSAIIALEAAFTCAEEAAKLTVTECQNT